MIRIDEGVVYTYVDEPAKWKTRILCQIHTAGPADRYGQKVAPVHYIAELGARSPLSAKFLSMDHYCYITHFANFKVRSSLNRSLKNRGSLLEKSAKTFHCS